MTLQPERVRDMFDRISPSYDRMNLLMSMGRDGCWRRLGVRASGAQPGDAALDVCCGTGDFAVELRRAAGPSGRVVGLDFSPQMLEMARRKSSAVEWLQGDALALPFADGEFAAACVGFGVRNLSDHRRGFAEMARVVRPGGRVVCLEMSTPPAPITALLPALDRPRRAGAGADRGPRPRGVQLPAGVGAPVPGGA